LPITGRQATAQCKETAGPDDSTGFREEAESIRHVHCHVLRMCAVEERVGTIPQPMSTIFAPALIGSREILAPGRAKLLMSPSSTG
jgi:hypothetical protein